MAFSIVVAPDVDSFDAVWIVLPPMSEPPPHTKLLSGHGIAVVASICCLLSAPGVGEEARVLIVILYVLPNYTQTHTNTCTPPGAYNYE